MLQRDGVKDVDLGRFRIGKTWFRAVALFDFLSRDRRKNIFIQAWSGNCAADARKPTGSFGVTLTVEPGRAGADGLVLRYGSPAAREYVHVKLLRDVKSTITEFIRSTHADPEVRGALQRVGLLPHDNQAEAAAEPEALVRPMAMFVNISNDIGERTMAKLVWRGRHVNLTGDDGGFNNDSDVRGEAYFYAQIDLPHGDAFVVACVRVLPDKHGVVIEVSPGQQVHGNDKRKVVAWDKRMTENHAKAILVKFIAESIQGYEDMRIPTQRTEAAAEPETLPTNMTGVMKLFIAPLEFGYFQTGVHKETVQLRNRKVTVNFLKLALGSDNLCELYARVSADDADEYAVTIKCHSMKAADWHCVVAPLTEYQSGKAKETTISSALSGALRLAAAHTDIEQRMAAAARVYANMYLATRLKREAATAASEPGPGTPLLQSMNGVDGREVVLPHTYEGAHVYATIISGQSRSMLLVTFEADHNAMEVSVDVDEDTPAGQTLKARISVVTTSLVLRSGVSRKPVTLDLDITYRKASLLTASKLVHLVVARVLHAKSALAAVGIWPSSQHTAQAAAEPRPAALRGVAHTFPKITQLADVLRNQGYLRADQTVYGDGAVGVRCTQVEGITSAATALLTFRFDLVPKDDKAHVKINAQVVVCASEHAHLSAIVAEARRPGGYGNILHKSTPVDLRPVDDKLPVVSDNTEAHAAAAKLIPAMAKILLPHVQNLIVTVEGGKHAA